MEATSYYNSAERDYDAPASAVDGNTSVDSEPTDFDLDKLLSSGSQSDGDDDTERLDIDSLPAPSSRRTTDLVRLYLQEIGRVRLLQRDEEVSEAQFVQRYMQLLELRNQAAEEEGGLIATYVHLLDMRDRLTAQLGHRPSLERWSKAAGVETSELKPTLSQGKRRWAELAELSLAELEAAQTEGIRAKEHMIKANLRLVVSVAKKYQNRGLELLDLIQEGT
ncbi:MAG: RNA polymerase sigma factor, RpoD/SigA family, partial [Leptolyngbya sp. SIO4C1]|nr:RNA polymerase sigma factor, RpoD/SigA family [Leptolyngbya sp. SIO4C1]